MKFTDILIITAIVGGAGILGYFYMTKSGPFGVGGVGGGGIPITATKRVPYESQYEKLMDMMVKKEDNRKGTPTVKRVDRDNPELTIFEADRYNREERESTKENITNTIAPDSELEWYSPITKPLLGFGESFSEAGESTLEWFGNIPKAIGDTIGGLGCMITQALGGTCSGGGGITLTSRDIMGTRESAEYAVNRLREAITVAKAQESKKARESLEGRIKSECAKLSMYGLEPPKDIKPYC